MRKILVVDEGPAVKALVMDALGRRSVEVLSADSGAQALEQIEREQPDLVVCDVYMPDVDGYRICDFVRAHPGLQTTPVLLMADVVDRTVLTRAARAGSDDVVRKPWPADELVSRIEGLLPEISGEPAAEPLPPSPLEASADPGLIARVVARIPGVTLAAIIDREGFLIDWAGDTSVDPAELAALASCLAESSEAIGRELGQGALQTMIFEYDEGLMLLASADSASRVAVVVRDPTALDAVRHCVKRAVPVALQAQ
jgi:CheY-like chemotaxis protein